MVKKEEIHNTIEKSIFKNKVQDIVEKSIVQIIKCGYSYKQMRAILSKYTQEEKNELLSDLMNDGEKELYDSALRGRDYWLYHFNNSRKDETGRWVHTGEYNAYGDEKVVWEQQTEFTPIETFDDLTEKEIADHTDIMGQNWVADWENTEREIMSYERRILEGYDIHKNEDKIPKINLNDYAEETSDHELERLQLSLQSDKIGDLTKEEVGELGFYFTEGSIFINGKIYNTFFWENGHCGIKPQSLTDGLTHDFVDKNFNKITKNLDSAIEKSEGLSQPTKLYSGMYWDMGLNPGDTYTVKGYISASYDKGVADHFKGMGRNVTVNGDNSFTITYLTPTGKKVICANDRTYDRDNPHEFTSMPKEHEALMGRNTECQVVSVDYKNKEATVKILS